MKKLVIIIYFLMVSIQLQAMDTVLFFQLKDVNKNLTFNFSDFQYYLNEQGNEIYVLPLDSAGKLYDKVTKDRNFERDAFLWGLFGQGWGVIINAMDGSADAGRYTKYVNRGFFTGLGIWTGSALCFGIKTVAIIYGCAYGLPFVIAVMAILPTLSSTSHRDINKIELFKKSNDNWILLDNSIIKEENIMPVEKLPRRIFKGRNQMGRKEILSAYKIDIRDTSGNKIINSYYAVEIISSSRIYGHKSTSNSWDFHATKGHRYQFYDKDGFYIGVRYLENSK